MYKRMSLRIVTALSEDLNTIAKKRGLSVNTLISEMAWDFVEAWKTKYEESHIPKGQLNPANPVGMGKEE